MDNESFRRHAHSLVDWMADYLQNVEEYSVLPDVKPGDIKKQFPKLPPEQSEHFEAIFADFKQQIVPGMTHWEPQFYGLLPRQ